MLAPTDILSEGLRCLSWIMKRSCTKVLIANFWTAFLIERSEGMLESVYIHIPFCEHICHYCDFNKFYIKSQPVDDYLLALDQEMTNVFLKYPPRTIKSIFVGGGTPTSLSEQQLEQLLQSIQNHTARYTNGELEFTFESNPSELSPRKLQILKNAGVNRLSIGVQAFDDDLLEKIGRTHRGNDAMHSIYLAKQVGFQNVNVDLIYSLPGQTIDRFKATLKQAFSLNIQHFSCYSLQVEPKTVFYNLMRKGQLDLPTVDVEATMYDILLDEMAIHGYQQYEVSNFAKPGYESRHNLTYWNNSEYYGIGAGAHSYIAGIRRANAGPLNKYLSLIQQSGFAFIEEQVLSIQEKMEEEVFLGLRKTAGVSKQQFKEKFNKDLSSVFKEEIAEQVKRGLIEDTVDFIRLTRKGLFLGNEVFQAFIK